MSTTARGHITISRRPKDGVDGRPGAKVRYRTYTTGSAYMSGAEGEEFFDVVFYVSAQQFFRCLKSYPASETHSPSASATTEYWEWQQGLESLVVSMLCANEAFLDELVVRHLFTADGKTQILEGGNLKAVDGEFSGTLTGVSGSFKSLSCINASGQVVGSITFSSEGRITFNSCDINHQGVVDGRGGRFYAATIYARRAFGSFQRTAMIVYGTYAYIYPDGLYGSGIYVSLASGTTSGGQTYYIIPTYSPNDTTAGCPIDVVIIKKTTTTAYYYDISMAVGKKLTVINSVNGVNTVYLYSCGIAKQLSGGCCFELLNVGSSNLDPAQSSSVMGAGILILSHYDNDWI